MLELVHIQQCILTGLSPPSAVGVKKKKGIESLEAFITDFIFSLAPVLLYQSLFSLLLTISIL